MNVIFSKAMPILIASMAFDEKVFLSMDGSGITSATESGAGKVSCQSNKDAAGQFLFHKQDDGTFTIESVQYPGVFLRMDGREAKSFEPAGSGIVNCQYGTSAWERFNVKEQPNGLFTIESAAFPGVYLRIDGNNPSNEEKGFGAVTCQFGAGLYEVFHLINLPE